MILILSIVALLFALVPAVLFCLNLKAYVPPPAVPSRVSLPPVSVLIPARDEERSIAAAVRSVLGSEGIDFEVIVMDDASTDRTAEIVRELAATDQRVRLEQAPALPAGWNGKQHACFTLAARASHGTLCFMDADVRVAPQVLARMAFFLAQSDAVLVSGFPYQETRTTLEWLLLPLIHFVLLGFLPVAHMRNSADPAFAAGCGQFMMVRRQAYIASGGHEPIKATMHDGLLLPRLLRQHGYRTDLADITYLATCRMYRSAGEVWRGLTKNATEGLAAPARIVPITLLLLCGQVLPFVMAGWIAWHGGEVTLVVKACTMLAVMAAYLPRILGVLRFRQPAKSAWLHPFGITLLLVLEWYALLRKLGGGRATWKQRSYVAN